MVKVSRLLKDYTEAGALNERLAVWGFVDANTFLTKAGAVGLELPQRRLQTVALTLPRALAQHLNPWIAGGVYAHVFDNLHDTLTLGSFQAFEFQGLEDYPRVVEALLFYVLYRANTVIRHEDGRSRLKLFLLDEAWRFTKTRP